MAVVLTDLVECTIHGRMYGNKIEQVFHWLVSTNLPIGTREQSINALRSAVREGWEDNMLPLISQFYTFDGVTTVDLDVPDGLIWYDASGLPGQLGQEAVPTNVAAVVDKIGERRRGARQGRFFVSGLSEAQTNGNVIPSGALESLNIAVNDLRARWTETGELADDYFQPVTLHGRETATPFTTQVNDFQVRPHLSHQDRRISVR